MKKIYIRKVAAKNFLAIGDEPVVLDFSSGMTLIQGLNLDKGGERSNGSGKSTIVEAVYWAIFGETLKKIKKKERIVNFTTKKECVVILDFDIEEGDKLDRYRIVRGIKPDTLVFTKNGEDISRTVKLTNEDIAEVISGTAEVFKNCLIMSLGASVAPFMEKEAEDRREFIEGIFGVQIFSEASELLKVDIKVQKSLVDSLVLNIQDEKTMRNKSMDELEEAKRKNEIILEKRNAIISRYSVLREEAKKFNQDLEGNLKNTLLELDNQIYEQEQRNKEIALSIDAKKTEQSSKVEKTKGKNREIQQEIESVRERYEKLIAEEDEIRRNPGEAESRILKEGKIKIDEITKEMEDWNLRMEEIRRQNKGIIEAMENEVKALESQVPSISSDDSDIDYRQRAISVLTNDMNQIDNKCLILKNDIARLGEECKNLSSCKVCPTCGQDVSKDSHIKEEIEKKQKEINEKQERHDFYFSSKDDLKAKMDEHNKALSKYHEQIESWKKMKYDIALKKNDIIQKGYELEKSIPVYTGRNESDIKIVKADIVSRIKEIRPPDEKTRRNEMAAEISILSESLEDINKLEMSNHIILEDMRKAIVDINTLSNKKIMAERNVMMEKKDISEIENEKMIRLSELTEIQTDSWEKSIASYNATIEEKTARFEEAKEELDIMNTAKLVLSDEGAKTFFIQRILDSLNSRIRSNLRALGSNMKCIFDKYLEAEIIDDSNHSTSYANLSGAERKTIDVALMLAFYSVKMSYGNVKYNVMFLDEVLDTSVDHRGVELMLDLIRKITTENNLATIVISHRKEIVSLFEKILVIKKENGISKMS